MGVVTDVATDIIGVITDVVSTVVDTVSDAVTEIVGFISNNKILVALAVVAAVVLLQPEFIAMATAINANSAALAAEGASFWATAGVSVSMYAEALSISMGSFLTAIHFSTLLSIHQVAYLVSEDYRGMIVGVYNDVARVSGQLDLGTAFLLLAHRNARNIVLDASSMMGQSYDLGEVTWLNQYVEYLRKFNDKASQYRNNPGEILHDIDEWLVKPSVDFKAGITAQIITSIDAAAGLITTTVQDLTTLRYDFGQLISDLPAQIQDKITPYVADIFTKYDTWIKNDYKPALKQFDDILEALGSQHTEAQITVAGLIERLKNPVDYLREIEWLGPDEREQQEQALYDLTTKPLQREITETTGIAEAVSFEMEKLLEALEYESPPPAWYNKEVTAPARPAGAPVVKRNTWFVGDF